MIDIYNAYHFNAEVNNAKRTKRSTSGSRSGPPRRGKVELQLTAAERRRIDAVAGRRGFRTASAFARWVLFDFINASDGAGDATGQGRSP